MAVVVEMVVVDENDDEGSRLTMLQRRPGRVGVCPSRACGPPPSRLNPGGSCGPKGTGGGTGPCSCADGCASAASRSSGAWKNGVAGGGTDW